VMHTNDLIAKLTSLELRTWSVFGQARAQIRDTDVAGMLSQYEVKPGPIKVGGINRNGYRLPHIEAAAARYVDWTSPSGPDSLYPSTTFCEPSVSAGHDGRRGALPQPLPLPLKIISQPR
jgi:hypothetical protein